ncbi:MAG TPA: hypothetical protein VD833_01575 [Vicinamibacterales bacterium]|nr:hypothetical protein [Vicinamibacterales bacterium]
MARHSGIPDVHEVSARLAALEEENARLRERLDALCEAAELWISLYERQLKRANQLAAECRRRGGSQSARAYWSVPQPGPLRMTFATSSRRRKAVAAG